MTSGRADNTRGFRSLLPWTLILLVVANLAVWGAWPLRDKLVAMGVLMPPPAGRVDHARLPLPPVAKRADTTAGVDAASEPGAGPLSDTRDIHGVDSGEPPPAQNGEPPPAQNPVGTEAPLPTAAPVSSARLDCVVAGPFGSREAVEAEETRLRAAGAQAEWLEETAAGPLSYLVYVEPAASRDAAMLILRELQAQSIEDAGIIGNGPYRNAVSVGVYSNRDLAMAQRDRVAELNYAVQMRTRNGTVYRLRVRQVAADALGDLSYERCPQHEAG